MINRKSIDKLLELPDDRLLMMLKLLLSSTGVDISGKKIDDSSIRRIRAVLNEVTEADLERVDALMRCYREGD